MEALGPCAWSDQYVMGAENTKAKRNAVASQFTAAGVVEKKVAEVLTTGE